MRLPSPVVVGRFFGDPDEEERGDDGALGDVVPGVGEPVQLRLKPPLPTPLPAPLELLELPPGLPGLLPGVQPPCCSRRIRKSLRLLSRVIRAIPRPPDGGEAETSSLTNQLTNRPEMLEEFLFRRLTFG